MLLTFPTKQSLLRKIQESKFDQQFLILSNYRKLADWNLIPLSGLTVLLGPNSAGKSSVCDAFEALNILKDGIRVNNKDRRIDNLYEAQSDFSREGNYSSVIGLSLPFPDIEDELKKFIESYLIRISQWDYELSWEQILTNDNFSFLKQFFFDKSLKAHISETTYTFIINNVTDENLDLSVYFDGVLAATFNWEVPNIEVKFKKKFIDFFFNEALLRLPLDELNPNSEFINFNFRVNDTPINLSKSVS